MQGSMRINLTYIYVEVRIECSSAFSVRLRNRRVVDLRLPVPLELKYG